MITLYPRLPSLAMLHPKHLLEPRPRHVMSTQISHASVTTAKRQQSASGLVCSFITIGIKTSARALQSYTSGSDYIKSALFWGYVFFILITIVVSVIKTESNLFPDMGYDSYTF